jgi:hypothetical protein
MRIKQQSQPATRRPRTRERTLQLPPPVQTIHDMDTIVDRSHARNLL